MKKLFLIPVLFLLIPLAFASEWIDDNTLMVYFNDTSDINYTASTGYNDPHNNSIYMGYELNFNDSMGDFGDTILSKWSQFSLTAGSYQYQNTFVTTGNGSLQFLNANLIKLQHNMFGSNQNGICDYFVTTDQSDSTANWGVSLANFGNSVYGRYTPASTTNWGYYTSGTSWTAGPIVMPLGISTTAHRIDCTGSTCNWYVEKDLILADGETTALNEVTVGVGHNSIISTEYFDEFVCWLPTNNKDLAATDIISMHNETPIPYNTVNCSVTVMNTTSGIECWISNDKGTTWLNSSGKIVSFGSTTNDLIWNVSITDPTTEGFEMNITTSITIPINVNNTQPEIIIVYPTNASTIGNTTEYPLLIYGNVTVQNGTLNNATINDTNWKQIGNQTSFNFTMNGTIEEGIKFYNITSISEHGNQTSVILQFTLDLTEPILKSTLSKNNTLIYAYQNLTYTINATDSEGIYSFNVSTPEGYSFEVTGINTTKYLYNGSINVSDYGIGQHTLTTVTCDPHTKNKIKNWNQTIGTDKRITYNFDNDYFFIRPLDPTAIEEVTTEKQGDRYSFTYKKNSLNKKEDFTFIVSSNYYIDIIGNSKKYSGWLVIPKLKKWIDFNTDDKKKLKYTLTRLSPYSVVVTIKGIKKDTFTFNSAGTLNCVQKDYAYYIYNYTISYETMITSNTITTLDLSIEYKDIFLNSTALINWNETTYTPVNISSINHFNYTINITPSKYTTVTQDINFTWNYTLNNTLFSTINYTQTISSIFLNYWGNLSNASAINFSFWDELNGSRINEAYITGDFNYLTNSVFSPTLTGTNNLTVAIYPPYASTTGDYTVYYLAEGYPERRYYEDFTIYSNNTQVIKLYLLSSIDGDYATFRIISTYGVAVSGVMAVAQKIIGTSLVTVEKQLSDSSGIVTFFVNPDDDYTFTFSKTGFVTNTITLRPITTQLYTITLEQLDSQPPPSYSTGLRYFFSPLNTILNNNTEYQFQFNLSSDFWAITNCTLNLQNTSEILATSSSTFSETNCDISIPYDTGKQTKIISEVIYVLNDTATETFRMEYNVRYTYTGDFSLMVFIDDIRRFAGAGFNDFTRMIITFLLIFSIVALASSEFSSIRDPETLTILAWGLVIFFSYVGFLTLNYEAIPDFKGVGQAWLQQYIIGILFSLGAASYIIKRHV